MKFGERASIAVVFDKDTQSRKVPFEFFFESRAMPAGHVGRIDENTFVYLERARSGDADCDRLSLVFRRLSNRFLDQSNYTREAGLDRTMTFGWNFEPLKNLGAARTFHDRGLGSADVDADDGVLRHAYVRRQIVGQAASLSYSCLLSDPRLQLHCQSCQSSTSPALTGLLTTYFTIRHDAVCIKPIDLAVADMQTVGYQSSHSTILQPSRTVLSLI
jgi:hypothetical protein